LAAKLRPDLLGERKGGAGRGDGEREREGQGKEERKEEKGREREGRGRVFAFVKISSCIQPCFFHFYADIYTVSGKKSLQFFTCNFNKFEVIFTIFCANHPETPLH